MTRDRPQLIELFGIPGAGKSCVAREICIRDRIRSRSDLSAAWSRQGPLQKAVHLASSLADARMLMAATCFLMRNRIFSGEPLRRTCRLVAKVGWLRAQRDRLLMDQWFLQDLWSILYSADCLAPDGLTLASLIQRLYARTDVLFIFIDLSTRCASERVAARNDGDSRLDGLSAAEIHDHLERSSTIHAAVVKAALAARLPARRVDGSGSLGEVVERVRNIIAENRGCAPAFRFDSVDAVGQDRSTGELEILPRP